MSRLEAFDRVVLQFPHIEPFRHVYSSAVTNIRELLTVTSPYRRPEKSRALHPFSQSSLPEVRRDKLGDGRTLSKAEFVQAAIHREAPLQTAAEQASKSLDEDLQYAIDYIISRGSGIVQDRNARVARLTSIAASLSDLRAALDACKSDTAQAIASGFNVAWTAACVDALGDSWPDKDLPLKYIVGFEVVFDVADSGIYRKVDEPADILPRDFKAGNSRNGGKYRETHQAFSRAQRARGC